MEETVPKKKRVAKKEDQAAETENTASETGKEKDLKPKKETVMSKVLAESAALPGIGDIVEGAVLVIEKSAIYINLPPYGTGIIYGREFICSPRYHQENRHWRQCQRKVVDTNNAEGYIELSLKEAKQALIWGEAEDGIRNRKIFDLPITDANKGGLIINWQGIHGFLPASQLKAEHYPRVADGDKGQNSR